MTDISTHLLDVSATVRDIQQAITAPGANLAETTKLAIRLQEAADAVLLAAHRAEAKTYIGSGHA